jgi:hypothetical protein
MKFYLAIKQPVERCDDGRGENLFGKRSKEKRKKNDQEIRRTQFSGQTRLLPRQKGESLLRAILEKAERSFPPFLLCRFLKGKKGQY